MSAPTTPAPLTTPEQRAQFADQARDRVTVIAALRIAQTALYDAANHETGTSQRVLRSLAGRLGKWFIQREDRLRDEFFPQAVELAVGPPVRTLPPYGAASVTVTIDGDDESELVYEAHPADETRESLYLAVENSQAITDPALDHQAADRIASHAPTAVPRIVQWLAAAERAGRQEAEEEAEREQERRARAALMTCPDCGESGRYVGESDIPSDAYDVRTASEWLETNEGLTVCDACGRRWWVMV